MLSKKPCPCLTMSKTFIIFNVYYTNDYCFIVFTLKTKQRIKINA